MMSIKFINKDKRKNSLIARMPPGTANASALERIACIFLASWTSAAVGADRLSRFQSLMVLSGAKFGMPLTVP